MNVEALVTKAVLLFLSSRRASVALDRTKGERRSCEMGVREALMMAAHTAGVRMVGLERGKGEWREVGEKRGRPRGLSTIATGQKSALGEARIGRAAGGVVNC